MWSLQARCGLLFTIINHTHTHTHLVVFLGATQLLAHAMIFQSPFFIGPLFERFGLNLVLRGGCGERLFFYLNNRVACGRFAKMLEKNLTPALH